MDKLDAMRTLLAAIDEGSLSGASRRLAMPLATVSRKVQELEADLGTQLLVRTARRLQLTDAGHGYIAAARRILDDLQEAERQASGEYRAPRGQLTITAPVLFGRLHVQPVVLDFLAAYPEIDVRLLFSDRNVNLIDDHVDAALRIGNLADSGMVAIRLGEVRWVVTASPDYLAKRGTPQTPEALAGHDCILFQGAFGGGAWSFRRDGQDFTVPITPRLVTNIAESVVGAAVEGTGITRTLSYQVHEAVSDGRLVRILHDVEPEPLPVHLIYAGHSHLPLKLRAFLDYARPRLKASIPPS